MVIAAISTDRDLNLPITDSGEAGIFIKPLGEKLFLADKMPTTDEGHLKKGLRLVWIYSHLHGEQINLVFKNSRRHSSATLYVIAQIKPRKC